MKKSLATISRQVAAMKKDKVINGKPVWHEAETNNFIELCSASLLYETGLVATRKHYNTFDRYFRLFTSRPQDVNVTSPKFD